MLTIELALSAPATLSVTIGPIEAAPIFLAFTANDAGLLRQQQIGMPAFRIAGDILLLMVAANLLLAQRSSLSSISKSEKREAKHQPDIAVFPLVIPLIAGPGSMTAVVLLMSRATNVGEQSVVLGASALNRVLGVTGTNVIARVSGILLAALAMQYVLDGLQQSRIFH